jgi:hypothetical protein
MEVELAHQVLDAEVVRPARGFDLEPRGLPLGEWFGAVTSQDLIEVLHLGR